MTVTDAGLEEPPAPVQVSDNVSVPLIATDVDPLVGSGPVHAALPLAVQAVAFWLLQVNVTASPAATVVELAVNVTVGIAEAILIEYSP